MLRRGEAGFGDALVRARFEIFAKENGGGEVIDVATFA